MEYKLKPELLAHQESKIRTNSTIIIVVMLVFGVILFVLRGPDFSSPVGFVGLAILVILISGTMIRGMRKGINQARRNWQTFQLSVTRAELIREIEGWPILRIERSQIESVQLLPSKGLIVKSKGPDLFIPDSLEGFEAVAQELSAHYPTSPAPAALRWNVHPVAVFLLVGAAIVFFMLSSNPLVVGGLGFLLLGFITWAGWSIQRNTSVDKKTRDAARLVWFVLIAIAYKMFLVLSR